VIKSDTCTDTLPSGLSLDRIQSKEIKLDRIGCLEANGIKDFSQTGSKHYLIFT
jgi:hypothetical protein